MSNGLSVSSSETDVSAGIRNLKKCVHSSAERQEAIGGIHFSNKQSVATFQPN
jgi:hypothetical protein